MNSEYEKVNGEWRVAIPKGRVTDVGCADFEQAKRNRAMVANKDNVEYFKRLESWLEHNSLWQQLPDWITLGKMPQVEHHDWVEFGGERSGLHEIE